MKRKFLMLTLSASAFLMSCAVSKSKTSTSKTMDIYGAGVIHKPVLVDLDVKETKVSGVATLSDNPALDLVKQHAVADAIKKASCDVLVEPTYLTETTGDRVTATVTGFPGTYKNFRSIKAEDVPLVQVGLTQVAKVHEPGAVVQKKKKKVGLIIVGAIVGAVAIGALVVAKAL